MRELNCVLINFKKIIIIV